MLKSVLNRGGWLVFAAAVTAMAYPQTAQAQCASRWVHGPEQAEAMSVNGPVQATIEWDGGLVMGGNFFKAAGQTLGPIVRWTGDGWASMGAEQLSGDVEAFAMYDGELYAGGTLSRGSALKRIARYDGSAWHPLGSAIMTGTPRAMAAYGGELIVGGAISSIGGAPMGNLARWNGSSWSAFGSGANGAVLAIAVHDGDLYIGGSFTAIDGVAANRIARWDGSAWHALDTGTNTAVTTLLSHSTGLIAGGGFSSAGGVSAAGVARWDGAWHTYGAGVPMTGGTIEDLAIYQGELVAGGTVYTSMGIPSAPILARWTGDGWVSMSSEIEGGYSTALDAQIGEVTAFGGELIVAGAFFTAHDQPSYCWARWTADGVPWIASRPADVQVAAGDDAAFSATAASGYDAGAGLTYQWRRDGAPITDGPGGASAGGGVVAGASTDSLVISGAQPSDAGAYDVVVSNECGSSSSGPAALAVGCAADFTGDGLVDFTDYLEFLNLYDAADDRADLTGDGVVDFSDYLEFLNHYDAGC